MHLVIKKNGLHFNSGLPTEAESVHRYLTIGSCFSVHYSLRGRRRRGGKRGKTAREARDEGAPPPLPILPRCFWPFPSHSTACHAGYVHYRVMDARGKFGEHERSVRVARGVVEGNSSFLSALQTSQVLHNSIVHS